MIQMNHDQYQENTYTYQANIHKRLHIPLTNYIDDK